MAYDEHLAQKVRNALARQSRVEEKNMMGGLTFMVNSKMCVGVLKDELMVRLNPMIYESALKKKGCREMNFTGRPMKGFVFVSPEGTSNVKDFNYWIHLALDFNAKAKASKK
ncbi:TfoX/Sxy family protein [Candidatus Gottesmanbacteria bacterium]|nr:TfoX/Sxy family protein [Candidatus Gottesmanbacteria bacterium]